jgi:hypothetical protein
MSNTNKYKSAQDVRSRIHFPGKRAISPAISGQHVIITRVQRLIPKHGLPFIKHNFTQQSTSTLLKKACILVTAHKTTCTQHHGSQTLVEKMHLEHNKESEMKCDHTDTMTSMIGKPNVEHLKQLQFYVQQYLL